MRTRTRPAVARDVDPIAPTNRPPADLVPEALAPLVAERDDVHSRLKAARAALASLTGRAGEAAEAAARKSDAAAAAEAARRGRPVKSPSANLDALAARRDAAARDVAALSDAAALVLADVGPAIRAEAENPAHRARLDAARDRLRAAAAELDAAAGEAAAALGVVEWLEQAAPFDGGAQLDVLDLVPALAGQIGDRGQHLPAVAVRQTIDAIAHLAG